MTPEELRELDRQVAETVFGLKPERRYVKQDPECGAWDVCYCNDGDMEPGERAVHDQVARRNGHKLDWTVDGPFGPEVVPLYSTAIDAAITVLDHFGQRNYVRIARIQGVWECGIESDGYGMTIYPSSSLPRAICRAAIAALTGRP